MLRVRRGISWWRIPRSIRSKLLFSGDIGKRLYSRQWYDSSDWKPDGGRISIGSSFLSTTFQFSPLHYAVATNVELVGIHATPILKNSEIVLTSKRDSPGLFLEELDEFADRPVPAPSTNKLFHSALVLSLASRLDMVYYHWVTEQLPQVFALVDAAADTGKNPIVVLRKDRPAFQDSSIKALFPDVTIVDYDSAVTVPHLLLSTIPTIGYAAHPVVLRLRNHAFTVVGGVVAIDQQRIYVKRKIGGWRYILNEDEVIELLSSLGFSIIDAAEYSFVEQIQLFRRASCVVSIFGSGLTNILFCCDATVIELAGDYADTCFASISGHVGNKHTRLNCVSTGDNITVDVHKLKEKISALGVLIQARVR